VASANGKDAEQLVKDAVARMLENQALFVAGAQRGIEQAYRGPEDRRGCHRPYRTVGNLFLALADPEE